MKQEDTQADLSSATTFRSIDKCLDSEYILNTVSSPYFIVNPEFEIMYCNKAFLKSNSISPDSELRGKLIGNALNCIHLFNEEKQCGTTYRCKNCNFRGAISKAIETDATVEQDIILTDIDNKMKALKLTVTPFELEDNKYVSISAIDITDKSKRQLVESLFFHDLINLTGSLSGYLDIVKDFPPEELTNHIPQIKQIADQILDEVMSQREITRAEQNRLEADVMEISITDFLNQLQEKTRFLPGMDKKHLTINFPEEFSIYSDLRLLDRILMNMVKNAIEAIKKNETVTLYVYRFDKEVTFVVHNPGYIAEDVQEGIFNFGFSTKGKGRGQGTYGMRLLGENLLKGKTWFRSDKDMGTTFYLRIPEFLEIE